MDIKRIKYNQDILRKSLTDLEKRLATSPYICGGSQMSIADLSAAHELEQGKMFGLDLSPYPKVSAWYTRMIDDDPISS